MRLATFSAFAVEGGCRLPLARLTRIALALGAVLLSAAAANAELITVDFRTFAPGTDVSRAAPGVTMRTFVNNPGDNFNNPIYSPATIVDHGRFGPGISTGDFDEYELCVAGRLNGFFCAESYVILELQFETPTDFVEIFSTGGSDWSKMQIFDELGILLAACNLMVDGPCARSNQFVNGNTEGRMAYASNGAGIGRVLVGGLVGPTVIQEVTYGVPEPATLGFVALGTIGAGLSQYRRRRTTEPRTTLWRRLAGERRSRSAQAD